MGESLWQRYTRLRLDTDRNLLAELYDPLAVSAARKVERKLQHNVDFDELVADARLGLLDAIARFKPERGLRFSTYSAMRITGAIYDGIRTNDHVPRLMRKRAKEGGPTPPRQQTIYGVFETDSGRREDMPITAPVDVNPAEVEDFWRVVCLGLNKAERLTIIMYFRLGLTMREIGRHLGLSESRVSQMATAIYQEMRRTGRHLRLLEGATHVVERSADPPGRKAGRPRGGTANGRRVGDRHPAHRGTAPQPQEHARVLLGEATDAAGGSSSAASVIDAA
jgi:RNA polymerase sigma factor (sigma-70 family)